MKYDFPKVELHLHLDGSMNPEVAYKYAINENLIKSDMSLAEFEKEMMVGDTPDLFSYLKCFDFPIAILQSKEALYETTYDLVKRLAKQNVVYAEIRFAPQHHLAKGLDMEEVIKAVLDGANKAMQDFPQIKVGIINCMMISTNGNNDDLNNLTIDLTKKYLDKGIIAIDLAGAEGFVDMTHFKKFFDKAHELNIPITCHAGESCGYKHVDLAMDFHASRIGHGGHALENEDTIKRLIENNITLELCPTSNIHCKNQESYKTHALKDLYQKGVLTTINTDNSTLSNITLDDEYDHVINDMGLSIKDIIIMNMNAIKASFSNDDYKQEVLSKLETYLNRL